MNFATCSSVTGVLWMLANAAAIADTYFASMLIVICILSAFLILF
jgi:hypothetical protein